MADATSCYHVELRSFPHVARAFNLDRETLDARFVKPWVAGEMIDYDDRRWAPDKTKFTVLRGPGVAAAERGLGRGWGEVTRHADDVTDAVVAEIQRGAQARPEVEALKATLAETAGAEGLAFADVVALAAAAHPGWRASEHLALAEQAVWEGLHQSRLAMLDDGEPIAQEGWQEIVLSWATWTGEARPLVRVHAIPVADAGRPG
jgi:hypothetical protein